MIISKIIIKIIKIPRKLYFCACPLCNSLLLQSQNIRYGKQLKSIGKINVINRGDFEIGDGFCVTSGLHINPICGNVESSWLIDTGAKVRIGDRVGMSSTKMWIHKELIIGNDVHIGANVLIMDTDAHQIDYQLRRDVDDPVFDGLTITEILDMKESATKSSPIKIENDVWICANSIILKGVTIGARSIIGAGSVVTKDIPSDCIAAGNPCKIIRKLV